TKNGIDIKNRQSGTLKRFLAVRRRLLAYGPPTRKSPWSPSRAMFSGMPTLHEEEGVRDIAPSSSYGDDVHYFFSSYKYPGFDSSHKRINTITGRHVKKN